MRRFAAPGSSTGSSTSTSERLADKWQRPLAIEERRIRAYAVALLATVACTFIALALRPYAVLQDQEMLYVMFVLALAQRFDVKVCVFAATLSVLSIDFFLVPPIYRLAFDVKRILTFVAIVAVAVVVSSLNERLRREERLSRKRAEERETLYRLNVELSSAAYPRQLAAITCRHLERLFGGPVLILLRSPTGQLEEPTTQLSTQETELMVQAWMGNEPAVAAIAGYATWVPLLGIHEPLGVIGINIGLSRETNSEEIRVLTSCALELATALERQQLASSVHRAQVEAETERMRASLLGAVSHDLKTPLANMIASTSAVRLHRADLEEPAVDDLLDSVIGEGERLSRLIQNLLSMARLESPTIQLRRSAEDLAGLLASAIHRLAPQLDGRPIKVELPPELPWVLGEPALIEQLLMNLLENACRYTPPGSEISISGRVVDAGIAIQIADRGPGILHHEIDKVFEKFFRGSQAHKNDGGTGLGLTICRAIVKAHGGKIALRGRPGGGLLVEFWVPVTRAPQSAVPCLKEPI